MHPWVSTLVLAALLRACSAGPFQLVSPDGVVKPAAQLQAHATSSAVFQESDIPVISVIDTTEGSGLPLLKALTGAQFDSAAMDTVSLVLDSNRALLYSAYSTMYGSRLSGSKVAEFCASVSNCVVVLLSARELSEALQGHDQLLRRLALRAASDSQTNLQAIVFLVDVSADPSASIADVSSLVQSHFGALLADTAGADKASLDRVKISVVAAGASDPSSFEAVLGALRDVRGTGSAASVAAFADAWTEACARSRPVLSSAQRMSLFEVEAAYSAAVAHADGAVEQWRARVNQGRLVGRFGDRAAALLRSSTQTFLDRTLGSVVVRDRSERLAQIRGYVALAVKTLYQQQLLILSSDVTRRFQNDMLQLASSGLQSGEEEQQLLRKALFSFRTLSADLESEAFDLKPDAVQKELAEDLQKVITDFPESPAARLLALQRVESSVRKPKKKGARAISVGLSLVGMFRPPGMGSLQGFANYQTLLLGLPFDILMGVQNDGDSAEIMGEDREHPILRLQPKLNFDIDL